MENKVISINDVVSMVIEDLRAVSIPAEYLETMGPHISRALHNLKILHKSIKEEEERRQKEVEEPEVMIDELPPLDIGGNEDAEETQLEGTVQE